MTTTNLPTSSGHSGSNKHITESLPNEKQDTLIIRTYSKIEDNFTLSNKKNLFLNLTEYYNSINEDYSENIPLTFLIESGSASKNLQDFKQYFTILEATANEDNKWI
jgi:hypothetical protein